MRTFDKTQEITSKTHGSSNAFEKRCVAILTRHPGESHIEYTPRGMLCWHNGQDGLLFHDTCIHSENNVALHFKDIYRNAPDRVSFDSELDISHIENYDKMAKWNEGLVHFERRLCIEFNMTKEELIKLLETDTNIEWYGKKTYSPKKDRALSNQLKSYANFARFDFYDANKGQWITSDFPIPKKEELRTDEELCECRIF